MEALVVYLLVGALAGLVGGLFGLGGGAVIVPILIYSFAVSGFSPEILTHLALGTSLATIIVTSASAVVAHHRKRAVLWPLMWSMVPGICLGAAFGGLFAATLSGPLLQLGFGVFLLLVAAQMGLGLRPHSARDLPGLPGKFVGSAGIGFFSGIFGIGGGSLTVPFLAWCNVAMARAVATSSALGFPIAISGAITYMLAGMGRADLPEGSLGYVYLPALFGIALASTPCARIGANLAHRLQEKLLRRLYAGVSAGLGVYFIASNTAVMVGWL